MKSRSINPVSVVIGANNRDIVSVFQELLAGPFKKNFSLNGGEMFGSTFKVAPAFAFAGSQNKHFDHGLIIQPRGFSAVICVSFPTLEFSQNFAFVVEILGL